MLKGIRHFFGIYTKEEREQQEIEEEQAIAERKRKQKIIEHEVSVVEERAENQSLKSYRENSNRVDKVNSTCPKCWSKNIVDKITRLQWEWNIDWYFRSSIFGGCWSISWHSEIDTNEVNNCNTCWHQRKKPKWRYDTEKYIIEDIMYKIRRINEWRDYYTDDKGILFLKNNNISWNAILELNIKYHDNRFLWGNEKLCFRQL